MLTGIYRDITSAEYHLENGISKSDLDRIARSPFHYRYGVQAETPAMRLGTAVHALILEPDRFEKEFALVEGRRKPERGKIELTHLEWNTCNGIAAAVSMHPTCRELFSEGVAEQSVWWVDPDTEVLCKCRPDWSRPGILADLKTTTDASPAGFARTVEKYRYHVQAAFYMDGWATVHGNAAYEYDFIFIAVEKEPPYAIGVYRLSQHAIAKGRSLYRRDLAVYDDCVLFDRWPSYSTEIETLKLREEEYEY